MNFKIWRMCNNMKEIIKRKVTSDPYASYGAVFFVIKLEEKIEGIPTKEPAFGLPAIWITAAQKERAEILGYTVVDPASVIITHISEIIKRHARELLGRQDVQALLENIKQNYPIIVDELVPALLTVGEIQKVLQNLLDI